MDGRGFLLITALPARSSLRLFKKKSLYQWCSPARCSLARGARRGRGAVEHAVELTKGVCGLAQWLAQATVLAQSGAVPPLGHWRAPCAAADLRASVELRNEEASIRLSNQVTLC
jgi:hypothetical protein